MLGWFSKRKTADTAIPPTWEPIDPHKNLANRVEQLPAIPQEHQELNELRASIEATIDSYEKQKTHQHADLLAERGTHTFYLSNGVELFTVQDLLDTYESVDNGVFAHHASMHHNDFANWLEGCFSEPVAQLGKQLRHLSREQGIDLLRGTQSPPPVEEPVVAQEPVVRKSEKTVRLLTPQHIEQVTIPIHPLPPSPLQLSSEQKVKNTLDAIQAVEMQASKNKAEAREAFVVVRTHVWQELDEQERKQVLPRLREVYDLLKNHS